MNATAAANARLAEALRAESLGQLADRALEGVYGDYTSPFGAPKMVLVNILREYGRTKLAARVIAGEFDG
jgi:hypothetical protein